MTKHGRFSIVTIFDLARLRNAFQYASTHNIRIAFSNESFELWLLLHLRRQEAAIGRKELIGKLKKHLGEYDKGDPTILDQLYRTLPDAYQRADILAKRAHVSQHGFEDNPYTGMYKLISALGESVPKVPSLESGSLFPLPPKGGIRRKPENAQKTSPGASSCGCAAICRTSAKCGAKAFSARTG